MKEVKEAVEANVIAIQTDHVSLPAANSIIVLEKSPKNIAVTTKYLK